MDCWCHIDILVWFIGLVIPNSTWFDSQVDFKTVQALPRESWARLSAKGHRTPLWGQFHMTCSWIWYLMSFMKVFRIVTLYHAGVWRIEKHQPQGTIWIHWGSTSILNITVISISISSISISISSISISIILVTRLRARRMLQMLWEKSTGRTSTGAEFEWSLQMLAATVNQETPALGPGETRVIIFGF